MCSEAIVLTVTLCCQCGKRIYQRTLKATFSSSHPALLLAFPLGKFQVSEQVEFADCVLMHCILVVFHSAETKGFIAYFVTYSGLCV